MSKLQPVRGTKDIYGENSDKFRFVIDTAKLTAEKYGFSEIITPIFEFANVFSRTVGEESDIVMKEMYTLQDKGGETLALRPEGTAGVVRAFISEGMQQMLPLKFFYYGPMFRYERPQKGRQRQFNQLGVEFLGVEDPYADVEIISLGWQILSNIGLAEKINLELNTIGDSESRENYKKALISYLNNYEDKLSSESKLRLTKNPLRILDSKDETDKEIIKSAPKISDYLNESSKEFFAKVQELLTKLEIPYSINNNLVRGLDYYDHTVFEFTTPLIGAQSTVLAGGRYNGLVKQMGGADISGVGFAAGIERLMLLCEESQIKKRPIVVIPVGNEAEKETFAFTYKLRKAGICTEMSYSGNVTKRMKLANKQNAWLTIIVGENELQSGLYQLKILDSGQQFSIKNDEVIEFIKKTYKESHESR